MLLVKLEPLNDALFKFVFVKLQYVIVALLNITFANVEPVKLTVVKVLDVKSIPVKLPFVALDPDDIKYPPPNTIVDGSPVGTGFAIMPPLTIPKNDAAVVPSNDAPDNVEFVSVAPDKSTELNFTFDKFILAKFELRRLAPVTSTPAPIMYPFRIWYPLGNVSPSVVVIPPDFTPVIVAPVKLV